MKSAIKKLLPLSLANTYRRLRSQFGYAKYKGMSEEQVFTHIYTQVEWGHNPKTGAQFYSGTGSHDANVVNPYVSAVTDFLSSLPHKPSVVDLGCGDFAVGSKIRHLCTNYVACDIVASLIKHNIEKYEDMRVDFRHVDITTEELPPGDVVFIRQVLQHLSNASIQNLVPSLKKRYKYIVLTEHICTRPNFQANLDKPTGPDTRLGLNSGVVLTEPPFNLKCASQKVICQVKEDGGMIQSIVITM
jgi:SAM-dependent methyltransferase